MKASVIIPAGGVGKRFGSDVPKQFIELKQIPIIVHSIKIFDALDEVESIVIPVHSKWYGFMKELRDKYSLSKVKEIVVGGKSRQESVMNALHSEAVKNADIVLVHDAVRPFADLETVSQVLQEAEESGAALPVLTIRDTIKECSPNGYVIKTRERSKLKAALTPQGFWYDIILSAYKNALEANYQGTDSSQLVEFMGYKVSFVEGKDSNIKITTPFDLKVAELIMEQKAK